MRDDLASLIDHTLLKPEATSSQIVTLCEEARRYGFATVCVNPVHVHRCAELLAETGVAVCTVVGFPLGASLTEVKVFEARRAIAEGASEIDMVLNIGALKGGEDDMVAQDIAAVVQACHQAGVLCKVIIEAPLLTNEEKKRACLLAKAAGADFVKTATGFGPGGATVDDVSLMRRTVGDAMGVKAAGGIRDLETTRKMIAAGATRIGTSSGAKIMEEARAAGEAGSP